MSPTGELVGIFAGKVRSPSFRTVLCCFVVSHKSCMASFVMVRFSLVAWLLSPILVNAMSLQNQKPNTPKTQSPQAAW